MVLRSRLIAAILFVALAVLGIFYYATNSVINQAFTKIEDQSIQQNTARAVDALKNRIDQLEFKATDWASWDDTYAFVENRNAAYIKSNLQSGSLNNLGIHYMLFFNEKQKLVESKGVSPDSGADISVPQGLLDAFKPGSNLLVTSDTGEAKGLIPLADQTVQFVALPILTSDSTGPYHGTLVFAFAITPDEVKQLSALTHLTLDYFRIGDPKEPADVKAAIGTPTGSKSAIAKPSENQIEGYQTINDVYGHPVLVARVQRARDIHETAVSALKRFLILIALDTALASTIVVILIMLIRGRDRTIALKNEFFSIANHELRTPLTVIRNYAQLMKFQFSKQVNDPKFDHMADSIDQAGAQLIGVVNVYLDAARLETGNIPFTPQPFPLSELCDTMRGQLTATGKAKGLTVSMDCPPELPPVLADKERVRQVILNLFGNAMKFTDTGSITIKAEVAKDKKMMMIYVTDTGRGMDEGAQRQLFQRFKQTQAQDALKGSGLGLFISKKLVEQMGGTIQSESSAPGIGTTLSFSLPLAQAGPAAPAATPPAGPSSAPPPTTLTPAGPSA